MVSSRGSWSASRTVPGARRVRGPGPSGGCAAGGYYYDRHGQQQGFVVSEQNGTWGKAIEVPGLSALSAGFAEVLSVSCGPGGDGAAGGFYFDRRGQQGFVVSEQNGIWGKATDPPSLAGLNAGGPSRLVAAAEVSSVSCDPAGDCAAGGYLTDRRGSQQGFVISEQDGTWGKAIEVPGLAALNSDDLASITTVSCTSAGDCSAGG